MSGGMIGVRMDSEGDDDFCWGVGFDRSNELWDAGVCLVAICYGNKSAKYEIVSLYDSVG